MSDFNNLSSSSVVDSDGIALITYNEEPSSSLSYVTNFAVALLINLGHLSGSVLTFSSCDCYKNVIRFTAGVIPRASFDGFERLIWRACRGNVFLRYTPIAEPIEVPVEDSKHVRTVFASNPVNPDLLIH